MKSKCNVCGDTGRKPGSSAFDCAVCDVAQQRRDLNEFAFAASRRDPETGLAPAYDDVLWAVHQRAVSAAAAAPQGEAVLRSLLDEAQEEICRLKAKLVIAAHPPADAAPITGATPVVLAQAPVVGAQGDVKDQVAELTRSGLSLMTALKRVKDDHAKVLEDVYSAMLWLHRRLPAAYKPLATIDQTIESVGRAIGYDAREALAEKAAQADAECDGCNGHGMVGNILDSDVCPFCHGSGVQGEPLSQQAGDVTEAEALADADQVPYLIVYDDADHQSETVIGGTRASYRFKQISASWNAHLYVKIASNSRDEKYPSVTIAQRPASAAAPAVLRDAELLAAWEVVKDAGNFHSMAIPTDAAIIAYARAILATVASAEQATDAAQVLAGERIKALEEAAKICDAKHYDWKFDDAPDSDSGPRACARSIRAAIASRKKGGGHAN